MVYLYRPAWLVPGGGAGVSVLAIHDGNLDNASDRNAAAASVRQFYDGVKAQLPSGVTITFPAEFIRVSETTGKVTDFVPVTAPGQVAATGSGVFANGVGARVVWSTGAVVGGRRVKGATFLVPLVSAAYDAQGTIEETRRQILISAANTLIVALQSGPCPLDVYSRENLNTYNVLTATVPDKVAFLRTRRE